MKYDKKIILDYLIKNNVNVFERDDVKRFDNSMTLKDLLHSNKINNDEYLFIEHTFYFGGNEIEVAKELLTVAKNQNDILPIKYINTNEYVECLVGMNIYNIIKEYLK